MAVAHLQGSVQPQAKFLGKLWTSPLLTSLDQSALRHFVNGAQPSHTACVNVAHTRNICCFDASKRQCVKRDGVGSQSQVLHLHKQGPRLLNTTCLAKRINQSVVGDLVRAHSLRPHVRDHWVDFVQVPTSTQHGDQGVHRVGIRTNVVHVHVLHKLKRQFRLAGTAAGVQQGVIRHHTRLDVHIDHLAIDLLGQVQTLRLAAQVQQGIKRVSIRSDAVDARHFVQGVKGAVQVSAAGTRCNQSVKRHAVRCQVGFRNLLVH
mmetsp:Transcript_4589/g.8437  ORF Transcript_4589/g.8437 Transcript_4589/m.8437 type:complete len:262 (-) Transcript_4589:1776-2561(-)